MTDRTTTAGAVEQLAMARRIADELIPNPENESVVYKSFHRTAERAALAAIIETTEVRRPSERPKAMTPPATQSLLPVTQRDRDAAWPHRPDCYRHMDQQETRQNWDTGIYDHLPLLQTFARHRKAHSLPGDVGRLQDALIQHNERLRSAVAIADRGGADTNWRAFRGQARFTLAEYQDIVNDARAAVGKCNGYAPGNYTIICIDCKKQSDCCDKRAIRCEECAAALLSHKGPGE